MSLIFELREIYLSFPKVLGLASASVLRAILDNTLGLEPAICDDCAETKLA